MNQFTRPPSPEGIPRNLKSHPEETLAALARVEGESWKLEQKGWTSNNVDGAIAWLDDNEEEKYHSSYIIYGTGGMNRYSVDPQGNVTFLKSHGKPERAAAEGFKIE